MKDFIGIGELAARSGRTVHTLRYYESVGLIPFVVRDAGGRRRYKAQHVEWLFFLERLQLTGMALVDMRQYTALVGQGTKTIQRRIALLKRHMDRIDQQMAELANSRSLLVAKIAFYDEWKSSGKYPGNGWLDAYRC
jgi:DNA-binding transcriptional MerR regulator